MSKTLQGHRTTLNGASFSNLDPLPSSKFSIFYLNIVRYKLNAVGYDEATTT